MHQTQEMVSVPRDGPEHPAFIDIFAVWNAARCLRRMPERRDIAPRDMKAYLPYVQLFEAVDGGKDFRIRLMGSDYARTMGYDPTGQLLSGLQDPVVRERTMSAAQRVVKTRKPVRTTAAFGATALVIYRKIERLLLPLGLGNEVTHVLCKAVCVDRVTVLDRPAVGLWTH